MRMLLKNELPQVNGGVMFDGNRGYVGTIGSMASGGGHYVPDPAKVIANFVGNSVGVLCQVNADNLSQKALCQSLAKQVSSGVEYVLEGPKSSSPEAYAAACAATGGQACKLMQSAGTPKGH